MSWAGRRQLLTFVILGALAAGIIAVILISTVYHSPSCTDGVQNQGEQGPDCGGPCTALCTALEEPPTVLFTQAVPDGTGRADVIALVENKNATAAAKSVPYTLTLHGADHSVLQTLTGTLELPPGATVPVFIPALSIGNATLGAAFLTIDPTAVEWYALASDPRIVPTVSDITLSGSTGAPRIAAALTNPDVAPMTNVKVIVLVRDASGNAIAASQTVVPSIAANGQASAVFSWAVPFSGIPVSTEVLPLVPLP